MRTRVEDLSWDDLYDTLLRVEKEGGNIDELGGEISDRTADCYNMFPGLIRKYSADLLEAALRAHTQSKLPKTLYCMLEDVESMEGLNTVRLDQVFSPYTPVESDPYSEFNTFAEYYCSVNQCPVDKVKLRLKFQEGNKPSPLPTYYCPGCYSVLVFNHYLKPNRLVKVVDTLSQACIIY